MARGFWGTVAFLIAMSYAVAALPPVPEAAEDEFGTTRGVPQRGGFVFIEGRYIPPPYTVTRIGNGIFINRIQVEQPVSWSRFETESKKAVPEKKVLPEPPPEEAKPVVEKPAGPAAKRDGLDILFGDDEEDDAAIFSEKPKEKKAEEASDSLDVLFGDAEPVKEKPAAVKKERPPLREKAAPVKPATPRSAKEIAREKAILKSYLDKLRRAYEMGLSRNEVYFFGTTHNRLNGSYGTARAMIEVLPYALKVSRSPEELMTRLRNGRVYFLDMKIVQSIFGNRETYPILQDRLKRIKREEAIEADRRRRLREERAPRYF